MIPRMTAGLLAVVLMSGLATAYGQQQKKFDFGKREYESNCAVCHGLTGKGDGPYRPFQTKSPADLTVLADNNGGTFPFDRVYSVIDGRKSIAAHGPREMPIWGTEYSVKAAEAYFDVPYDPESYVRTRILALTEYVARLQMK